MDLHLKGLEAMGAVIDLDAGYIEAAAPSGLKGARIVFPVVSVGATENLLMAAAWRRARPNSINAAREPEIERPRALPDRHGRARSRASAPTG